ncbi:MAG: hypothetical protein LBD90_01050, partial [Bifidobacteriaceae bacterium]|nr:hypothetical protein [Bifidobacteriaceae bacterium]
MRRLVWVAVGVGLGAGLAFVAWRRLEAAKRSALDALSPEGVARGVDRAVLGARDFAEQVRAAAREREAELRRSLL